LKTVSSRLRGAAFRKLKGVATAAESKSRFAGIDWTHTRAWSEEMNYFPSVRINLKGRDPHGQVAPEDYDAVCDELCAELSAFEAVERAVRRDECFDGPYVDHAPDIIVELALEDGYSHSCLRSRGGPAFRRIREDEVFGGKERGMTGNHRPTGILMLSKPTPAGFASLQDVAPTIYAELGVPGPAMDGTSLLDPCAETNETNWQGSERMSAFTEEQSQVVEERLRSLGYFE
jgi:predicted AlkP superfamily phosphohydrolase/phosphomutase